MKVTKKIISMAVGGALFMSSLGSTNRVEKAIAAKSFDPYQVIWFNTVPENDSSIKSYLESKGKAYYGTSKPAPIYIIDPNNNSDNADYGNKTDSGEGEAVRSRIVSRLATYLSLPIGNGRLGAQVYGSIDKEIVQINEDTFYTLQPSSNRYILDPTNPSDNSYWAAKGKVDTYKQRYEAANDTVKAMLPSPEPKSLVEAWNNIKSRIINLDNKHTLNNQMFRDAIEEYVFQYFTGDPYKQAAYQSFVELYLNFGHDTSGISDYTRSLDLSKAIATVEYKYNGIQYKRENFVSADKQAIVTHLTASGFRNLNVEAELHAWQHTDVIFEKMADNQIAIRGKGRRSELRFEARLVVDTDGDLEVINVTDSPMSSTTSNNVTTYTYPQEGVPNAIKISNANYATCYVVGATSYINFETIGNEETAKKRCDAYVEALLQDEPDYRDYEAIKAAHIADYQKYYNRSSIKLEGASESAATTPTGTRFTNFAKSSSTHYNDPSTVNLYYNFAKYLMISGSREGSQPLNLQGIWNASNMPAWDSKYTININTEMNYWMAQTANLAEFEKPLLEAILETEKNGTAVAKEYYGIDGGYVVHHNFDIWRGAAPVDSSDSATLSPVGSAWLLDHAWEYYQFNLDEDYLLKFYPLMKKGLVFYDGLLTKDPVTGYLISPASVSPEQGGIQPGPTYDHQLIRNLYRITIQANAALKAAGKIGNEDDELVQKWKETMNKICPNQVGSDGYIKEWIRADKRTAWGGSGSEVSVTNSNYNFSNPNVLPSISYTSHTHKHKSHLWDLYPGRQVNPFAEYTGDDLKLFNAFKKSSSLSGGGDGGTGWGKAWRVCFGARMNDVSQFYTSLSTLISTGTYPNGYDKHPPFQIDGNFGGAAGIQEALIQSYADTINILPALPEQWPDGEFNNLKARGNIEVSTKWKNGKPTVVTVKAHNRCQVKIRNKYFDSSVLVVDSKGDLKDYTTEAKGTVIVFNAEEGERYNIYLPSGREIKSNWTKMVDDVSSYLANSSGQTPKSAAGTHIGYFENDGTEIGFAMSNCDFDNLKQLLIEIGVYTKISEAGGGMLYVRIGGRNGTEIGRLVLPDTGGQNNFQTVEIPLNENAPTSGKHTLYFLFVDTANTGSRICNVKSVTGVILQRESSSNYVTLKLGDTEYNYDVLANGTYTAIVKNEVLVEHPNPVLIFALYEDSKLRDCKIFNISESNKSAHYTVNTSDGGDRKLMIMLWKDIDQFIPMGPARILSLQ